MTVFVQAKTKKAAVIRMGESWPKVVKVHGGWLFFDTLAAWKIWKAQK